MAHRFIGGWCGQIKQSPARDDREFLSTPRFAPEFPAFVPNRPFEPFRKSVIRTRCPTRRRPWEMGLTMALSFNLRPAEATVFPNDSP
jgi:hypothetical protein